MNNCTSHPDAADLNDVLTSIALLSRARVIVKQIIVSEESFVRVRRAFNMNDLDTEQTVNSISFDTSYGRVVIVGEICD